MPEQGYYEKVPRPESIDALVKYLESTKIVQGVQREGGQSILVRRIERPALRTFMTNIYIVGLADVHEIFTEINNLDAIVTMSAWNSYTAEAKVLCRERNVGLFTFKEFLGAVYYVGSRYLDYIPPDEREHRRRRNHGR